MTVGLGGDYSLRIAGKKPNCDRCTLCSTNGKSQNGYSRKET